MDKLTTERRSWNMSKIQSADTKPEILVRSLLHRMGYRFRLHRKDLPGRPDIVLPRHKAVILVHGCFWHRHSGCKFAYTLKTRQDFWTEKFEANVRRDAIVRQQLGEKGWRIFVIWECELNDLQSLKVSLRDFLAC